MSRFLPHYRVSSNETEPKLIVENYLRLLALADTDIANRSVLEIGAGRTNLVAKALRIAGACAATAMEPFVQYDAQLESEIISRDPRGAELNALRIHRVESFEQLGRESIDIVLSNSVLEHVVDLSDFFSSLRSVMCRTGVMLHVVDYRDHFFKYPFGFLTFDESTWQRWLNPGDLPRWRLADHVAALEAAGFVVDVLERQSDLESLRSVQAQLCPPFDSMAEQDNAVTRAVLAARRP